MPKKKILLLSSLAFITLIISVSSIIYFYNRTNNSNVEIKEKENIQNSKTEKEKETEKEEINTEQSTTPTNENQNITETPKEETNNSQKNTPQSQTPNTSHQNQAPTENHSQTTTPPVVETPSCTPKKFYTVFRPDFDSMSECQRVGNQYKDVYGYYGFICDYDMDDCGTTYYMLTMFDGNGNYIDYPNIPKP